MDAHVEVPKDPKTPDEIDIWLTDRADTGAKKAVQWHALSEYSQDQYKNAAVRVKYLLRELGANLAEHPRPRDAGEEYVMVPRPGRSMKAKVKAAHHWYWTHKQTWRCRKCLREKQSLDSKQDFAPCGDVTGTIRQLGLNSHSHSLSVALVDNGPEMLFWCRRCGGMAETYAKWLAQPKCRQPTCQTKRTLTKLGQMMHPARNAVISDVWDLTGGVGAQHVGQDSKSWAVASCEQELAPADAGSSMEMAAHQQLQPV